MTSGSCSGWAIGMCVSGAHGIIASEIVSDHKSPIDRWTINLVAALVVVRASSSTPRRSVRAVRVEFEGMRRRKTQTFDYRPTSSIAIGNRSRSVVDNVWNVLKTDMITRIFARLFREEFCRFAPHGGLGSWKETLQECKAYILYTDPIKRQ